MKYTLLLFAIFYLFGLVTSHLEAGQLLNAVGVQQPPLGACPRPTPAPTQQPPPAAGSTPNDSKIHIYYGKPTKPTNYAIGDCIPMKKDGQPLSTFQLPSLVTCYSYKDECCQDSANPLPIPLIPKFQAPNLFGSHSPLFKSFNCYDLKNDPFVKPLVAIHPPNGSQQ